MTIVIQPTVQVPGVFHRRIGENLNINCFLINIQGRITLIDSGIGMDIGVLLDNIRAPVLKWRV